MKQRWPVSWFLFGAFAGVLLPFCAPAQDTPVGPTSAATSTIPKVKQSDSIETVAAQGKHNDGELELKAGGTPKHSTGIEEILKMVQAGVSTEVIKLYIENSQIAYNLSATDIIALKEHAVSDDLTSAMIKRGAALRTFSQSTNVKPIRLGSNGPYNALDPESYEYFQYYYLLPSTLAAANQRLWSSVPSDFSPYSYRFYGPLPLRPPPPSVLGQSGSSWAR